MPFIARQFFTVNLIYMEKQGSFSKLYKNMWRFKDYRKILLFSLFKRHFRSILVIRNEIPPKKINLNRDFLFSSNLFWNSKMFLCLLISNVYQWSSRRSLTARNSEHVTNSLVFWEFLNNNIDVKYQELK